LAWGSSNNCSLVSNWEYGKHVHIEEQNRGIQQYANIAVFHGFVVLALGFRLLDLGLEAKAMAFKNHNKALSSR